MDREKRRLIELAKQPVDHTRRRQSYGSLDVEPAIDVHGDERRAQALCTACQRRRR